MQSSSFITQWVSCALSGSLRGFRTFASIIAYGNCFHVALWSKVCSWLLNQQPPPPRMERLGRWILQFGVGPRQRHGSSAPAVISAAQAQPFSGILYYPRQKRSADKRSCRSFCPAFSTDKHECLRAYHIPAGKCVPGPLSTQLTISCIHHTNTSGPLPRSPPGRAEVYDTAAS